MTSLAGLDRGALMGMKDLMIYNMVHDEHFFLFLLSPLEPINSYLIF
jgi:hypothetical protein